MYKALLALVVTWCVGANAAEPASGSFGGLAARTYTIQSAYYALKGEEYPLPTKYRYGAIAPFDDTFLFMDHASAIYIFKNGAFEKIQSVPIKNNRSEFVKNHPEKPLEDGFTVKGMLIANAASNSPLVLVSAFYYDIENDCHNISVFKASIKKDETGSLKLGDWQRIFNTVPCLKLIYARENRNSPGNAFNTVSAGGRIQQLNKSEILLSVGDLENNGLHNPDLVQDKRTSYGKTIKINIQSGASSIFTIGHRNPQGLYISKDGRVFETEHGPLGGDELNQLREGKNYGWPLRTFGVDYSFLTNGHEWEFDTSDKAHSGYAPPLFSWVPSIAVSNLTQVTKSHFSKWRGNLLIGSLGHKNLYRVFLERGHVIMIETINFQNRIRDLIELSNGNLAVMSEELTGEEPGTSKNNIHIISIDDAKTKPQPPSPPAPTVTNEDTSWFKKLLKRFKY